MPLISSTLEAKYSCCGGNRADDRGGASRIPVEATVARFSASADLPPPTNWNSRGEDGRRGSKLA